MQKKVKSKREDGVIIAAKDLFWRFGFKRVTVEEICKKASISKMTFYRLFPNKTELAKRILDIIIEDGMVKFKEIMKTDCSADERMHSIVQIKLEGTREISREFIEDIYTDSGSELQHYMVLKTKESWQEIISVIRDAQQTGVLRKGFKPELLVALSTQMAALLEDKSIMTLYSSPSEVIMELTNIVAYGIAPEK
ncbi:MAG: hypothetical protein CVU13_00545 [Bacteroidetes bacterium HGW-Bacteroidetes-8]|jgi:AcrR family transcriptional regulator|nr:MAG: hypothetical protein CVU13_00545 [Bacteroidetes bacterium HGW-Bacteroidetes-8]